MDKFQVVVGNIGTVYSGNNYMIASSKYASYVKDSKANYGRAAGEPVTLFHNGEIKHEYEGTLENDEERIPCHHGGNWHNWLADGTCTDCDATRND